MHSNKISRPFVGADLSRPSPIYRPSVAFHSILFNLLLCIIVSIVDLSALGRSPAIQIIL